MDLQGLYFSPCLSLFIAGKCYHILYIFMTFSMLLWFPNHPSSVFWSNSLRWILGFQSKHCKVRSCVHRKWCQEIGFIPYSLPTHWITIGKSINLRCLGFSFRKMKSLTGLQIEAVKSTSPPAGSIACTTRRADARVEATSQVASGSLWNRKRSSSESHWLPSGTLRPEIFKPSRRSEMSLGLRKLCGLSACGTPSEACIKGNDQTITSALKAGCHRWYTLLSIL